MQEIFGTLVYVYVGEVGEGENGGVMQRFSLMLAMSYVLMAINNCVLIRSLCGVK